MFGLAGRQLTSDERSFLRGAEPFGIILFRRNCETPDQVARLVGAARDAIGRDCPVLIDQEGGRVARMRPPVWPAFPPADRFGRIAAQDPQAAVETARLNALAIGRMLADVGVTVNAAPVLDLRLKGASDVVGDRALDGDPAVVSVLGRAICDGLLQAGVLPVIKHLPGHGRAMVDSHFSLPHVDASLETLRQSDFLPFKDLADQPVGMTAHVVFTAIDPSGPATQSRAVIDGVVRGEIGFDGLLLSDDLSMGALSGPIGTRAERSIAAGCDVVLHCNGSLSEMEEVAAHVPRLSPDAVRRAQRAETVRTEARHEPASLADLTQRLERALAGWA